MTNVLVDFHHSDLLESLHRLFEGRLGMTVYVPRGLEWFDEGIWQFGHKHFGNELAKQFLLAPEVDSLQPHRTIKMITVEQARSMSFDVVCATVQDNQEGYHRFAQEKGARYVVQVGNVNQQIDFSLSPIILDASGQFAGGTQFTPEFDIDGAFRHEPPTLGLKRVASFVNLFPGLPCYGTFAETMALLPDWTHRVYGHNGPDGFLKPTAALGDYMRASSFIWQDKVTGDGFGYVVHYAAAVGRPLIGHASHYRGQTAADVWDDLVTCIDLDQHTPTEVAYLMDSIVKDDRLEEMGEILSQRVRSRIDWDADAQRVSDALAVAV